MKIIEKKDNEIVFSAEIGNELANAIRRYMNNIPILAIDEVEIEKNDSPLYDETVAHRLGLVPFEMASGKEGAKIKLNADKEGIVYSKELKGMKPVYDSMPITSLNKNQELKLTATVSLGMGKDHSKFSPGIMNFRNSAEVTMDKGLMDNVKKIFPDNEVSERGNNIIVKDNLKREILDFCEGLSSMNGKKAEAKFNDELIVSLESFGQIGVRPMFKKAIEELKKNLSKVSKSI